ncbi:hypothetical protein LPJ61_005253 [Coemansia biformis]|uniref:CRAL-TRIO domain-containing protein n=1 Tax=Coemansia biformis TaxID=1286918 RepID=A0A9W7Y3E0_9FUNG|nr:hypothetical protein LPJ61_005253 [Coemansia biformis]
MSVLAAADSQDERVARGVAFEAREIRDRTEGHRRTSTYIPSYIDDYLDDTAAILRQLQACRGDSGTAVGQLARTLEWREETKVYPTKRQADLPLLVDSHGMVLVRSRRAPVLAGRPAGTTGRDSVWRGYAHGVGALEDARVALRTAYERSGVVARAAVVVAVESVRLADLSADVAVELAAAASKHYPLAVGRVYVTAASSVLLEHARVALQPALHRLESRQQERIVFMLESALSAEAAEIGAFMLRQQQQQQQQRPSAVDRMRGALSKSTCSIYSGDADDFQTACSESCGTHVEALDAEASLTPTQSVTSLAYHSKGDDPATEATLVVEARSAMTSVQLASLQRAVQSVQRMLGTISDGVGGLDSHSALAATKGKLAQQADVLMSAVAALSVGISMMRPPPADDVPAAKQHACFVATPAAGRECEASGPAALLKGLALQLLALPVGLVFGRRRGSIAGLWALAARTVRSAARRLRRHPGLRMALLLAYRHLRVYAVVLWTGALLAWQANAATIWASLSRHLQRGIAY